MVNDGTAGRYVLPLLAETRDLARLTPFVYTITQLRKCAQRYTCLLTSKTCLCADFQGDTFVPLDHGIYRVSPEMFLWG